MRLGWRPENGQGSTTKKRPEAQTQTAAKEKARRVRKPRATKGGKAKRPRDTPAGDHLPPPEKAFCPKMDRSSDYIVCELCGSFRWNNRLHETQWCCECGCDLWDADWKHPEGPRRGPASETLQQRLWEWFRPRPHEGERFVLRLWARASAEEMARLESAHPGLFWFICDWQQLEPIVVDASASKGQGKGQEGQQAGQGSPDPHEVWHDWVDRQSELLEIKADLAVRHGELKDIVDRLEEELQMAKEEIRQNVDDALKVEQELKDHRLKQPPAPDVENYRFTRDKTLDSGE